MSPSRARKSLHRYQKGLGLPGALFILVILALIVVAITNLETQTGETMIQDVQSTRAFFAAESGAQAGLATLFGPGESGTGGCTTACSGGSSVLTTLDFDLVSGGPPPGLGGCSFSVACCRQTDSNGDFYYTLTSTGSCGDGAAPLDQARRVVEVGARELVAP